MFGSFLAGEGLRSMTVRVCAKHLFLSLPALAMILGVPAVAVAQGMSEWGVWDSPRRSTVGPAAQDDDQNDQQDNGNGYDRGDDGRYYDPRDDRSGGDRGGAYENDPRDDDPRYGGRQDPDYFDRQPPDDGRAEGQTPGADGGQHPFIAAVAPPQTPFSGPYAPGSIVIDTGARKLYFVTSSTSAYAYSIGVGRQGFAWTGTEKVSRIQDWPDWYPPAEMRRRKPEMPARMLGGIRNPLGVKAIYLGNTLYRVHGTNDPKSIGKAESSGCFRMLNENVLHLASLVHVGTPVTVVRSLERGVASASKTPLARQPAEQTRRYSGDDDRYDDDWRYRNEARFRERPFVDRSDPYWEDPYPYRR